MTLEAIDLQVDEQSPVPLYHQVATRIRDAVDSQRLPSGTVIGPEKALATEFGVSLPTVRKALDILTSEGITVRKKGRATFVSGAVRYQQLKVTTAAVEGPTGPRSRLLTIEPTVPDAGVLQHLQIPAGAPVWCVVRRETFGDCPTAILRDYLLTEPTSRTASRIAEADPNDVLLLGQVPVGMTRNEIAGTITDAALSREFNVPLGTPLIVLERTTFSPDGRPVEFGRHEFLASRYRFECST